MGLIELTTKIKAPIEVCFDLSRSIDIHKLSTAKTKEMAIAGITSGLMNKGEFVTWRAKHFGIWQELTTEMREYEYPSYLRTIMVKGAFKKFDHEHIFKKKEDLTEMTDRIVLECPLGSLGKLAETIVIDNYIKNLMLERNSIIKQMAEQSY